MSSPRLLILFTFATVLVVGVVVALATDRWWVLGVAVVVHAIASVLVISAIGKRLSQQDKVDPLTEAKREEETSSKGRFARGDDEKPTPAEGEDRELVI
jgi:membrane protein implicated in regulation of membrane protease activity